MTRPRTSAFVGVTLDGFLARPDDSFDYLAPYEKIDHGYQAFFASVDTVVVGRRTHEVVLGMVRRGIVWPYQGKRCVVLTHRPLEGAHGEEPFAGEPAELLAALEGAGARHVYVDGGVVVRAFLAARLLDDLTVSIVPLLIGAGRPLFGGVQVESGLTFVEAVPYPDGLIQLRYRLG